VTIVRRFGRISSRRSRNRGRFGAGSILAKSVTDGSNFLSPISAHHTILILDAFLILLNAAVDVAKAVLFFPILEIHGRRTRIPQRPLPSCSGNPSEFTSGERGFTRKSTRDDGFQALSGSANNPVLKPNEQKRCRC